MFLKVHQWFLIPFHMLEHFIQCTELTFGQSELNGFVSEFMCLLGTFQSGADGVGGTPGRLGPWFAFVAGTGMIIAAIYLLYMVGKVVFGPLKEPAGHHKHETLPHDLTYREVGILVPLAAACVFLGLWPTPVLNVIAPANQQLLAIYEQRLESWDALHHTELADAITVDAVIVVSGEEVTP